MDMSKNKPSDGEISKDSLPQNPSKKSQKRKKKSKKNKVKLPGEISQLGASLVADANDKEEEAEIAELYGSETLLFYLCTACSIQFFAQATRSNGS